MGGWFSLGRFAPRCARESMNVNGGADGETRSGSTIGRFALPFPSL